METSKFRHFRILDIMTGTIFHEPVRIINTDHIVEVNIIDATKSKTGKAYRITLSTGAWFDTETEPTEGFIKKFKAIDNK
jgi:hypothetical protein